MVNQSEELSIKFKNSVNNQFSSTKGKDDINFNGMDKNAIELMIKETEYEKKNLLRRLAFLDSRLKNLKNCFNGRRKVSNETEKEVNFTPRNKQDTAWKLGKSRSLRDIESSKFGNEEKAKFKKMNMEMEENNPKLDEGKLKAVNSIVSPTRIPQEKSVKKEKRKVDKGIPESPFHKTIAIQSTNFEIKDDDVIYSQKLVSKWEKMNSLDLSSQPNPDFIKRTRDFVEPLINPIKTTEPLLSNSFNITTRNNLQNNFRRHQLRNRRTPIESNRPKYGIRKIPIRSVSSNYNYPLLNYQIDDLDNLQDSYLHSSDSSSKIYKKKKISIINSKKKNYNNKKLNLSYRTQSISPVKKTRNLSKSKRRKIKGNSSIKPSIYFN